MDTTGRGPSRSPSGLFTRLLAAYIAFSRRYRFLIVAASVLVGVLGSWYSTRLKVDPNLDALLPKDTETIRAMQQAKARLGSSDLYTIALSMDDPAELARLQDRLADSLRQWPEVVYVQVSRDNSFFRSHALLYLPIDQLQRISARIEDLRLDLGHRGPLTVDLLDDEPAPAGPEKPWFDADLPQQLGLPDEAAESFARFLKNGKQPDPALDAKAGLPDSLHSRLMGRAKDGRLVALVQASLSKPSSDFDFVKTVVSRSHGLLDPLKAEYNGHLQASVEGPYRELAEVNSLSANGILATVISVGLNILIIAVYFRSIGTMAVILIQAILSCILTLAMTTWVYGDLNLYTAFVVSILFGMGIDFT
ncbi:MAG: MMPL family transporter, partial [Fibrobacteres bacterium]|nr:MMPL family transporter [Fibrobacterota bacterium]